MNEGNFKASLRLNEILSKQSSIEVTLHCGLGKTILPCSLFLESIRKVSLSLVVNDIKIQTSLVVHIFNPSI